MSEAEGWQTAKHGLAETTCGYVTALDFADRSLDLGGSEGAIYNQRSRAANERAIVDAGSRLFNCFTVSEDQWWEYDYMLIEARLEVLWSESDDVIFRKNIAA